MRMMSHGVDGSGSPWLSLGVTYWHPGLRQVRSLAIQSIERGVAEGTISADGEDWATTITMNQRGVRRSLLERSGFRGPDTFHVVLLEEIHPGRFDKLVEWDFKRASGITPVPAAPPGGPPRTHERLRFLEPLRDRAWVATDHGGKRNTPALESSVEWVPFADGYFIRTTAPNPHGEPTHLLDAYLYHHTGTGAVRCLALANGSGVFEGDVHELGGGAFRVDLTGSDGERTSPLSAVFEVGADGIVRMSTAASVAAPEPVVIEWKSTPGR